MRALLRLSRFRSLLHAKTARSQSPGAESHLGVMTMVEGMEAVAAIHGVNPAEYAGFCSLAAGRDMAALLRRRYAGTTLAEPPERFGLWHR